MILEGLIYNFQQNKTKIDQLERSLYSLSQMVHHRDFCFFIAVFHVYTLRVIILNRGSMFAFQ